MPRLSTSGRADNLHGIVVFLRVVDAGSLSRAARSLGVSPSAVSATLARLEERLDTRLLNRTTRRLEITEEGREFYERCKKIVADIESAELSVGRAGREPSGFLRVGLPSTLGARWIVPSLGRFIETYPAVSLEVVCTDFVPFTIREGLDVAVQIGELHDSSLAVRRLADSEYVVCASPAYLRQHGTPAHPDDLAAHRCLTYRRPRNGKLWDWRFRIDGELRTMGVRGIMTLNSNEAIVSATGLGIIQVADYYADPSIRRGDLVEILRAFKTDGHVISAVFPKEQPYSPKIRAFVDFLARQFDPPPWTKRPPHAAAKKMSTEFAGDGSVLRPDFTRPQEAPAVKKMRQNRIRTPNASA
jgi:DNA-binding transcriptional LysR family regulator